MSNSKVVVIDLDPSKDYYSSSPINKFVDIPKPRRVQSQRLKELMSLRVGESYRVEGYVRNTINSWACRHGRQTKRKFVTRSLDQSVVEIYRVE